MMMRHKRGRAIGRWGPEVVPEANDLNAQRDDHSQRRGQTPLQTSGRPHAEVGSYEKPEIESADVDQQPFQNIRVSSAAKRSPSKSSGIWTTPSWLDERLAQAHETPEPD
jgi:hypothetical protein